MNKRLPILALSAFLVAGPLAASEPAFVSAAEFDATPYCASVDRAAEKMKPAQIEAVLDKDADTKDGYRTAHAVLVSAAIDIAHASADEQACLQTLTQGLVRFEAVYGEALKGIEERRHRFKRRDPIRSIQQRITQLWQRDQAGRFAYLQLRTEDKAGPDFWAARLSVANSRQADETSKRYIRTLLKDYDWVDKRRFGQAISDHAWILVQHADSDPEFQREVLGRMEPYLANGGIRKRHYAYLYDRVAVNTGQMQLYGTQPTWECEDDGTMRLKPLKDPDTVNQRRADMGLNAVEDGLAEMARSVCG